MENANAATNVSAEKTSVRKTKLKPSDFVHLHNHTHYSLLDGLTKVDELIDFVKSQGMEAVAVTDHGTMSGLIDLYKTATDADIKPILGLEAYVAARRMEDRDPAYDKERFHITLLAMNDKGFENLCRMPGKGGLVKAAFLIAYGICPGSVACGKKIG